MLAPFIDPFFLVKPAASLPMVGREGERQMLVQLLDTVAANLPVGPRSVTISGEMGIGKSLLLAETARVGREKGFRVLEMRSYASNQPFPYFPLIEELRKLFRSGSLNWLRFLVGLPHSQFLVEETAEQQISLIGAPLVNALARIFPELPGLLHIELFDEPMPPDQEKFRLFDALATLFERLALEQPLLLCLDNLQWLDRASLELLFYLIIRLRSSRVALLGATRLTGPQQDSDEVQQRAERSAAQMLGELMQQGYWYPLLLAPLQTEALKQHLQHLLPGEQSVQISQMLLPRAEGNPFFLEELVRTFILNKQLFLQDGVWTLRAASRIDLPESIISAVRTRLQFLSPACFEMLVIASLFGRSFPLEALVLVLQQEHPEDMRPADGPLEEAVQAFMLVKISEHRAVQGQPMMPFVLPEYAFCQGIFQETLQQELAAPRVRLLHQRIAQALESCYGQEVSRHAGELAAHYAASNDRASTLRWSLLAGEEAMQQQAHQRAIDHFRLALQLTREGVGPSAGLDRKLPSSIELALVIGELWFRLGELKPAAAVLQRALEENLVEHTMLVKARIHRMLADIYRLQANYEQALAHLQIAQSALTGLQEVERAQVLVPWFFQRRAVQTLERISREEELLLLQAKGTLAVLLNQASEAETALWQAHQLATQLGDRSSQAFSLHLIGWIYGWGERIHEALRLQQQAHALYLSLGDPYRAALGIQGFGIIYQALGEMDVAQSYTRRGFELAERYGVRMVMGWLHWNQGVQALMQGQWEESAVWLQQASQIAQAEGNARLLPVVLQAWALLQCKRGLWQEAERYFQDALQAAANTDWFVSTGALYGHFLAITGRRAGALIQLERARELPEPLGFSGSFFIPFLAEGYLHLDTPERARGYKERLSKMANFLYYGLSVERILGELAVLEQDWEAAEQAFAHGLELCQRADNQPEMAAILYEQARMGLIRNTPEAGIRQLCEQARQIFQAYQMQRAVSQVDTLLAGLQPGIAAAQKRQDEPLVLAPLSAREREVLQLVAEGHTDREVAEVLVLSHRTIHRHLSNIFVKLGVPGRAAAVAYAIRHGLV